MASVTAARPALLFLAIASVVLFLSSLAVTRAQATVIRVPADRPTIQQGINASAPGETVLVSPGTYLETGVNYLGKSIVVRSTDGPLATFIDGFSSATVVRFVSGETASAVLEGFTIQHGSGSNGGGIQILDSSPTIRGNRIRDNAGPGISVGNSSSLVEDNVIETNNSGSDGAVAIGGAGKVRFHANTVRDNGGVGVSVSFSSAIVQGNTISGNNGNFGGGLAIGGAASAQILDNVVESNHANDGGAMELFAAGTPTLMNNIIRNNGGSGGFPAGQGGALWIVNFSDALIVQNLFVNNRANEGGAIWWLVPSGARGPILLNNTIAYNDGATGSGLFADGFDRDALVQNNIVVANPGQTAVYCGNFNDPFIPTFSHNDVYSATGPEYGGIAPDLTGLNGNISADPLFVSPPGDLHLMMGSPCVDAGAPHPDLPPNDPKGLPRVADGDHDGIAVVDIGWDELDMPTATTVSVVTSEAGSDGVHIVWEVTLDADQYATIYRQEDAGAWAPLRHALPDAQHRVTLDDRDVRSGQRYGYRIGVRSDARETYFGEVRIEVPLATQLALAGFSPNPTTVDGAIAFTLAGTEPATLEMYDVTGRRVLERRVTASVNGPLLVRLRELAPLAPGVYVVRLTQGGRSLLAKGALIR